MNRKHVVTVLARKTLHFGQLYYTLILCLCNLSIECHCLVLLTAFWHIGERHITVDAHADRRSYCNVHDLREFTSAMAN